MYLTIAQYIERENRKMRTIKLDTKVRKEDKTFLDYYTFNERAYIMALFINMIDNTRKNITLKTDEDFQNFNLLYDTAMEFWDELDSINEVFER